MYYSNLTAGLEKLVFPTSLPSYTLGSSIKTFCRIRQVNLATKNSITWSSIKPRQSCRELNPISHIYHLN